MENRGRISLQRGDTYLTERPDEAIRVKAGSVYVYVVRMNPEGPGHRVELGEVSEGTIPAFAHRDMEGARYHFLISAKEPTELVIKPEAVTSVLLRNFADGMRLAHVKEEGFENSILELHRRDEHKGTVQIARGGKNEEDVGARTGGEVVKAFNSGEEIRIEGENECYRAVSYINTKLGQKPVDYDKARKICRDVLDVPNVARALELVCREIVLEPDWYRHDCGAVIGQIDKQMVACFPKGQNGYTIFYADSQKTEPLTRSVAATISPAAYAVERTLPRQEMKLRELIKFGYKCLNKADLVSMLFLGLVGALIGVLLPTLNQKIYDDYILMGDYGQLIQICVLIGSFMLGNLFFSVVKSLSEFRLQSRVGYAIQDAVYHRFFQLPEHFVQQFESADLAQRLMSVSGLSNSFIKAGVLSIVSVLFSIVYLIRMFKYSSKLSWISFLMLVAYCVILLLISLRQMKIEGVAVNLRGDASSKLYQYLSGIEKIRVAGVENRAIYDFMRPFAGEQAQEMKKSRYVAAAEILSGSFSTLASMVLYYVVVKSKVEISMGSFIGFNTAFGSFSAALMQLIEDYLTVYQMKPTYRRFKPIAETACEDSGEGDLLETLEGEIEISHLDFSYAAGTKPVLSDLNLQIKKGEYLGIVGSSGCGKSTLIKILLGFERPTAGNVYYDGKEIDSLDKQALRRKLGVVLQNGKLFAGSIYENITITNPKATMADVKRVVEQVGLKEDIEQMPMGLHTVLGESSGTISGGQKQRILIARALINDPSVVIFDEATSALDNLTQAAVSEYLDRMDATRLVVAHRLSTIRNCHRIIVMDRGRIAEEGDYESLMQKRGLFYELASRQIAE